MEQCWARLLFEEIIGNDWLNDDSSNFKFQLIQRRIQIIFFLLLPLLGLLYFLPDFSFSLTFYQVVVFTRLQNFHENMVKFVGFTMFAICSFHQIFENSVSLWDTKKVIALKSGGVDPRPEKNNNNKFKANLPTLEY